MLAHDAYCRDCVRTPPPPPALSFFSRKSRGGGGSYHVFPIFFVFPPTAGFLANVSAEIDIFGYFSAEIVSVFSGMFRRCRTDSIHRVRPLQTVSHTYTPIFFACRAFFTKKVTFSTENQYFFRKINVRAKKIIILAQRLEESPMQ